LQHIVDMIETLCVMSFPTTNYCLLSTVCLSFGFEQ
jgi:hypothetical protein